MMNMEKIFISRSVQVNKQKDSRIALALYRAEYLMKYHKIKDYIEKKASDSLGLKKMLSKCDVIHFALEITEKYIDNEESKEKK